MTESNSPRAKRQTAKQELQYAVLCNWPNRSPFKPKAQFCNLSVEIGVEYVITTDKAWALDRLYYLQQRWPDCKYTLVTVTPEVPAQIQS